MIKIRLARGGSKKKPFYRLIAATSTAPRDGKFLEKLGTYNPLIADKDNKSVIKKDRVDYWLSKGAQPTKVAYRLISNAGIKVPEKIASKMQESIKVSAENLKKKQKSQESNQEKPA